MGYPYRFFRQNAWPLRLMICAPLILQTSPAFTQDSEDLDGGKLLQSNCGRCHAVEQTGNSPLQGAPPLRDIYRRRSTEQLEFEFAEGMGSRHPEMPQIQFSSEEIAAILTHLARITNPE